MVLKSHIFNAAPSVRFCSVCDFLHLHNLVRGGLGTLTGMSKLTLPNLQIHISYHKYKKYSGSERLNFIKVRTFTNWCLPNKQPYSTQTQVCCG